MAEDPTLPPGPPPPRPGRRDSSRSLHPLPELTRGTRVAGYEVEARLGAGGYGTVYLARCGAARVAMKLLPLESSQGREEREVDVLRRSKHTHIVRLYGYFNWPEDAPRFRVLVMEYVEGLSLDAWADRFNPSALEVVEVLLPMLEALEAVHDAGVVHRDLKPSNILVRAADGQPVLVDFGAGSYEGAPPLTSSLLPPGTAEYRGPEAWDFFRRNVGEQGARYAPSPADDLWAVGVLLYWLLTDRLPFTGKDFLAVGTAVLTTEPVPPCERNPQVPEALGSVCLRLLAKPREARYASARELRRALEALKSQADAFWRIPLFESPGPHNATTQPQEHLARGQDLGARLARVVRQQPVRGPELPEAGTAPAPSRPSNRQRWQPWAACLLLLAGTCLRISPSSQPPSEVEPPTQLRMSADIEPISKDTFLQEVDSSRVSHESVEDAALTGKPIPAPVSNVRHRETDMRVTNQQPPTPPSNVSPPGLRGNPCLGLTVAAMLATAACAPPSVVQKAFLSNPEYNPKNPHDEVSLPAVECNAEALANMKRYGFKVGDVYDVNWSSFAQEDVQKLPNIIIGPQPTMEFYEDSGPFKANTVLVGRGERVGDRVYVRFGLIQVDVHPGKYTKPERICMEVLYRGQLGVPYLGEAPPEYKEAFFGGVFSYRDVQVRVVDHWE